MSSNKHNYPVEDEFIIDNLDTLKILTHPQRIEIIHSLRNPKTVKQIAEEIEADPTKLYYHIRQMEKVGAIRVVETNIVSGIVEKKYLVSAKSFRVESDLFNGADGIGSEDTIIDLFNSIMASTSSLFKRSVKAGLIKTVDDDDDHQNSLMAARYRFTPGQLKEFKSSLKDLLDDFASKSKENENAADGATDYTFTLAFFPLPADEDE